jgi:P-type Mg2+ transporter
VTNCWKLHLNCQILSLVSRSPRPKRELAAMGRAAISEYHTTFFVMLWVFHCWDPSRAPVFQTGWFVESLMTQTLIVHVIRTNKIPFLQSRASRPLMLTTLAIMLLGPYSQVGSALGFAHLPHMYWPILMLTLLAYVRLTQVVKEWLLRKKWI